MVPPLPQPHSELHFLGLGPQQLALFPHNLFFGWEGFSKIDHGQKKVGTLSLLEFGFGPIQWQ